MKRTNNMKRGGSFMPPELREEIGNDPEYSRCALLGLQFGPCEGRITREHALIHAGKKIQTRWSIIPLCAAHHEVDFHQDAGTGAPKDARVWVALNRASDEDLYPYSKVINYVRERSRLNDRYGTYAPPPIPDKPIPVKAPPLRPRRKIEPLNEFERETKLFARENGCSVEAAQLMLETLV